MGDNRRSNNHIAEGLVLAQFDNIVSKFKCGLTAVAAFQFMSAQDESLYINFLIALKINLMPLIVVGWNGKKWGARIQAMQVLTKLVRSSLFRIVGIT